MSKRDGGELQANFEVERDNVQFNSGLFITWAVLLSLTVLVMVCRGTITQHEMDQLWLTDQSSPSLNSREHHRLLKLVRYLRPVYLLLGFGTALTSAVIAGIYVVNVWPYVHIFPQH